MASTSTRPGVASGATRQAPLLSPHHKVYLAVLVAPVVFFTLLSLVLQTHAYNVWLSEAPTYGASVAREMGAKVKPAATMFAQRGNFINRYFIKYAWGWTTLAWLGIAFTLRSPTPQSDANQRSIDAAKGKARDSPPVRTPEDQPATIASPLSKSLLRYLIATMSWVIFALWLFGPSLMERIFTLTGGACLPRQPDADALEGISNPSGPASSIGAAFRMPEGRIDEAFCRAGRRGISKDERPDLFRTAHLIVTDGLENGRLRGVWRGGHDVSGHTFILILASLLLLEDLTPFLSHYLTAILPPTLSAKLADLVPRSNRSARDPYRGANRLPCLAATSFALGLIALWILSLVNTALFFHTPQEKFSGAIVALVCWALLPKDG